jgi:hypothetical protein
MRWLRSFTTLITLALGLLICAEDADARLESELRLDGTGAWAYLSPPLATTMLDDIAALDDPMPVYAGQPSYSGGSLVGLFSRPGLLGGFAAGFLGAGLFGFLFGQGVSGGLTGAASGLGLLFQLALLVMLVRLIWTWWRTDRTATAADLSPRQLADAYGRPRHDALPDNASLASAENALGGDPIDAVDNGGRPGR